MIGAASTSPVDIDEDVDTNTSNNANVKAKAKAKASVDVDVDADADANVGETKAELEASDRDDDNNENDDGESNDDYSYDDDDSHSTPLSTDLTSAVASALIVRRHSSISDSNAKAKDASSSSKMTASERHSFLLNKAEALLSTTESASASATASVSSSVAVAASAAAAATSVSNKRKSSSISSSSKSVSSTAAVSEPQPGPAPLRYVHPSFTTGIPPVPPLRAHPLPSTHPYPQQMYNNQNYANTNTTGNKNANANANATGNMRTNTNNANVNTNASMNGYGNRGFGQILRVPTPAGLSGNGNGNGNGNINRSGNGTGTGTGTGNINMYGQSLGHSQVPPVQIPIPIQPRASIPRVPTPAVPVANENMYGHSLSQHMNMNGNGHGNRNGYGIRNVYEQMSLNRNFYGTMNGNMNANMNAYQNRQGGLMNANNPFGYNMSNGYGQLRQHINGSLFGNQLQQQQQQQQQYMNRNPYTGQSQYLNGNTNTYVPPHHINGNVNVNANGPPNMNGSGARHEPNSYNTSVNVNTNASANTNANTNVNTNQSLPQSPIMATANNMETSAPIPKNVSIARAAVPARAPAVRVVIDVDADDAEKGKDEVEYVGMVGSPGPQSPYMQARIEACRKKDERGPRIVCVSSIVASSRLKERKRQQSQAECQGESQSKGRSGSDDQQDQIQIPPQHLEEINTKVLARAFSWTCYHHMDQYDQELLWIVEASKYLRPKSNSNKKSISPSDENQSRLDYVKNNISDDLAVLTDISNARSVSGIIREQSSAMERIQKMEFIAKRSQAPMVMKALIDELCIEIGGQGCARHKKRQLESYFLNERWNRYEDCTAAKARGKDVIKRDETVYICETGVNEGTGESELTCYRCIVLGCKEVEKASCSDGFVYYNVMKDDAEVGANGSHLVERVHAESVLTADEIGELIDMEVERLVAILTPSRKGLLL